MQHQTVHIMLLRKFILKIELPYDGVGQRWGNNFLNILYFRAIQK